MTQRKNVGCASWARAASNAHDRGPRSATGRTCAQKRRCSNNVDPLTTQQRGVSALTERPCLLTSAHVESEISEAHFHSPGGSSGLPVYGMYVSSIFGFGPWTRVQADRKHSSASSPDPAAAAPFCFVVGAAAQDPRVQNTLQKPCCEAVAGCACGLCKNK